MIRSGSVLFSVACLALLVSASCLDDPANTVPPDIENDFLGSDRPAGNGVRSHSLPQGAIVRIGSTGLRHEVEVNTVTECPRCARQRAPALAISSTPPTKGG